MKRPAFFLLSIFSCYAETSDLLDSEMINNEINPSVAPEAAIQQIQPTQLDTTLTPASSSMTAPNTSTQNVSEEITPEAAIQQIQPTQLDTTLTPASSSMTAPDTSTQNLAKSDSDCTKRVCQSPVQMVASHNFGRGVGHKGYSSLDLFFIKDYMPGFYPFADFRFHVMDEGRLALNSGVGFRKLVLKDRLSVGGNIYYDYRHANQLKTSQVSGGVELLSQHIDFRLNGYVPVGDRKYEGSLQFADFSGHQINTRRKTQYAFASTNGEFGIPLPWMSSKHVDTYLGLGAYYLFGEKVAGTRYPSSWGGKFKFEVGITDYLDLKFELNQDRIFHTTCQGVIALNIPLYKKSACSTSCSPTGKEAFLRRTLRPVMRNEIIPVKKKNRKSTLKDSEGNEYQAFFVNNLASCPGLGTFESPFCTLSGAQIAPAGPVLIYVFEGNSPTNPYTGGFVMKEGQTLQGSGTALSLNGVTIPPQTSTNPFITSSAAPAITIAPSTTVQGLHITTTGGQIGLFATDAYDVRIMNNTFNQVNNDAIQILNHSGQLYIANNTITDSANRGIQVGNTTGAGFTQITQNVITNASTLGILIRLDDPGARALLDHNTITGTGNIYDIGTEVYQGVITIESNVLNSGAIWNIHALDGAHIIRNNICTNTNPAGTSISYDITGSGIRDREAYIYGNNVTAAGAGTSGIAVQTFSTTGSIYTEIVGNQVNSSVNPNNGIHVDTLNAVDNICASITQNVVNNNININSFAGSTLNIQQTAPELSSQNSAASIVTSGVINYGSTCTAP